MAKRALTRQPSNKAGLTSLGKKMDSSRHGFNPHPASRKAAGASGQEPRSRSTARKRAVAAKGGKAAALGKMKRGRQS